MAFSKKDYFQLFKLIILLCILMAGIVYLRLMFETEYDMAIEFVKNSPDSEVIFLLFFIISSAASFPTLPLNVLAGLLYGTVVGGALVVTGAVLGSYLTYYLLRHVKNKRAHTFEEDSLYARLAEHDFDWKTIIFLRLNIFLPTFLVNTVLAGTNIGKFKFFITALIGFTPFSFLISYLGNLANGDMEQFYALISQYDFSKHELF